MHNLSYKSLFIIIAFLLIPIIFLIRLQQKPTSVMAEWFNDAWNFRQAINIASHTVGETNVYIVTTVNIGTTAKAQTDDGDFRFVDRSGNSLPYYIASGVGTTSITFNIFFASFPAGAQTIYAYYGNQSATNGFSTSAFATLASSYSIGSLSAEETGGGPAGWWKFDEGVGTSAFDSTPNKNNGAFSGGTSAPTWTDQSQCISGKCLYFNGTSSSITIPNASSLQITGNQTIVMWLKPTQFTSRRNPIGKAYGGEFTMTLETNGDINYYWGTSGANSNPYESKNSSTRLTLNQWNQIVLVRDITNNNITWYINGSQTSQSAPGYTAAGVSTLPVTIGTGYAGGFMGYIDDVKIYPYARTLAQIKIDYNNGLNGISTNKSNTLAIGSDSSKSLSNGLVGYWKMDENIGTSTVDSSGNNNTAIFGTGSSAPSWSSGKFGIGLSFGGSQVAMVGSTLYDFSGNSMTLSSWVYLSSTSPVYRGIMSHNGYSDGYRLMVSPNNSLHFQISGDTYALTTDTILSLNTWNQVVATYDGSKMSVYINGIKDNVTVERTGNITPNGNGLWIGTSDIDCIGQSWCYAMNGGSLDEIRIYNRSLNTSEINALYNYAPGPIGYWKLDEGVGSTIYDSSSTNAIGTLAVGNSSPLWSVGKLGNDLNFDGVDSYATINSAVSSIKSISFWMKPSTNTQSIIDFDNGTHYISLSSGVISATGFSSPSIYVNGVGSSTVTTNVWQYITINTNTSFNATALTLGKSSTNFYSGDLDEIKLYNYPRSPKQITQDMGSGVASKYPIAYWKFDEGNGQIITDSSGNNNNGTLGENTSTEIYDPTWTAGKISTALQIGTSSYAIVPSGRATNFGTSNFTVSAWVNTTNANYGDILSTTGFSNGWRFGINSGGLPAYLYGDAQYNGLYGTIGSKTINDGNWHQLTLVYVHSNSVYSYIDGLPTGSADISSITGSVDNTNPLSIGTMWHYNPTSAPFLGKIDEIKIFNYALNADEVKLNYSQSASITIGVNTQTIGSTTTSLDYCVPGDTGYCAIPVGEWKFNEGAGTTAYDSSGNGNHGSFSGAQWQVGKIGNGVGFTGTGSINMGSNSILNFGSGQNFTLAAWVKPNSTTDWPAIINKGAGNDSIAGYRFEKNNTNQITFYIGNGTSRFGVNTQVSVTDGKWHYVEGIVDATGDIGTTNTMYIYLDGVFKSSTSFTAGFNYSNPSYQFAIAEGEYGGSVDEVKVYNYARSPAQIAYDYNKGAPIAWWKMDECQGSITNDSSGNNNPGTISIGASGTQTSLGTCAIGTGTSSSWTNGATGKYNGSLNFDGLDDHIIGAGTSTMANVANGSVSFWVYPKGRGYSTGNNQEGKFWLGSGRPLIYGVGQICIYWYTASNEYPGCYSLSDNVWTHVVTTWANAGSGTSNGVIKLYSNGVLKQTFTGLNLPVSTTHNFDIGMYGNNSPFNGQIDDMRLYGYPLTQKQINLLYTGSSLNFK